MIHFFLKEVLETNVKSEIADFQKLTKMVFTLSVQSPAQVDGWERKVESQGEKHLHTGSLGKIYY